MDLDYERIAQEFIRALRGPRSQTGFSRRLGYATNVVYQWEAGRTFPTASVTLRAARRAGLDVRASLRRYYRVTPAWLEHSRDPTSAAAVAALLEDLLAGRRLTDLAIRIGRSRFAAARWIHGETEPRLPDFFRLIQGLSLRLLDFVAVFVDPEGMESLAAPWQRLETSRRAAYEAPWTHAVLRVLELRQYRALPRHEPGFIARQLGIDRTEEERCLALLSGTGQIRMLRGHWTAAETLMVDTRSNPEAAAQLRKFWTKLALDRLDRQQPDDVFSFNLGTLAVGDLERVRDLHRRYFNELRTIIAESEPPEAVLLANIQLLRLV